MSKRAKRARTGTKSKGEKGNEGIYKGEEKWIGGEEQNFNDSDAICEGHS